MAEILAQAQFRGIRDNVGENFLSPIYLSKAENVSYDNIIGSNKILFPQQTNTTEIEAGADIDGIFEYKYTDNNGISKTLEIVVTNGKVYKNWFTTPVLLYSGLTVGAKCTATTQLNELFIANGKDYQIIYNGANGTVRQQGSPEAITTDTSGSANGTYYYAITYVTSGGEESIGTISNSVTVLNKTIQLNLPLGYDGTLTRNLYRTEASGTDLYLVANIPDNVTLTYNDTKSDADLGAGIPDANNELPKVYYIKTANGKIIGCKNDKYPTQIYVTDEGVGVFDLASYSDTSAVGDDRTAIVGMGQSLNQIAIGTKRNIYMLDTSNTAITLNRTNANIGMFDGDTVAEAYSHDEFQGGLFFVSSSKDIRVFNGNLAIPVASSLDNLKTENFGEVIKGTLENIITEEINYSSAFFDDKYHLVAGDSMLTFNIHTQGWATLSLETESYRTTVKTMGVIENSLYLGMDGSNYIEEMYKDTQYKGENYACTIRTGALPTFDLGNMSYAVSGEIKYFLNLAIYFLSAGLNKIKYKITLEDDTLNTIQGEIILNGGVYSGEIFSGNYFDVSDQAEDYRIIPIQRYARWLVIELSCEEGMFYFKGYRLNWSRSE